MQKSMSLKYEPASEQCDAGTVVDHFSLGTAGRQRETNVTSILLGAASKQRWNNLKGLQLLPESQGQNLVLTVLFAVVLSLSLSLPPFLSLSLHRVKGVWRRA